MEIIAASSGDPLRSTVLDYYVYQRRFVVSMENVDKVCNGKHSCKDKNTHKENINKS